MDGTIEQQSPVNAAGAGEPARAKINLALHVLGRRGDGLHNLDSLVVFADAADEVEVEALPERGIDMAIDGTFAPELELLSDPDDNLVVKAAYAIANLNWRSPPGVRIHLRKDLPVAAGLGGGSADAAATLRLLNRHWDMRLDDGRLAAIAAKLGADVPMCLASRPTRAGGVGDRLQAVDLPEIPMVLVNPGVALPTASVFRALAPAERPPLPDLPQRFRSVFELAIWLRRTRNDLFQPARELAPVVGRACRALQSDPDCLQAAMSGSGPTCYGIFASDEAARRAATRIHAVRPGWWVIPTRAGGN